MSTIAERAKQLLHERKPFVHATVVRAQPPTSAHAGDEAILLADGTIEGFVGGQCAQNSVRKAALGALQAGESVLLRVLPDGDVHFPDAPGACVVVNPCLSGGALEIFLTPQFPAPLVRICGSTPIADNLAQVCDVLGYEVRRDGEPTFDGATAVVIATHGGSEAETVRAALDAGVGYVGLVASRVRGASVLDSLNLDQADRARVHTPVGLPIGAKTPAEIAVSIAAEVIAGVRRDGLPVAPRPHSPATAVDPVCGMTVTIGSDTPHVRRGGETHWFCCPGCRSRFLAARA
ncbi:xanthine dehydrogenase accessory factor [Mycolicibacterium sp. BK556]|uniref:XdhC family protein n=1 Tax=Mycobacteriaceae TaxID=1762 RepID=UPI001060B6DC|nr:MULTISPECIES: XdhC family protein [Mycobacteriaceae]MBB3604975.1 xanthine dehydrogenase accessory factor [Mycolicibacterium sp. BK556]MBB3635171.1 xanthine dehydrogenase accessory factor [Mycolicibacterium sp. BK607]MBB3748035.1 xanthine dehydrogenase accessory factor [Mycolicibacterium sp. BK634]TDO07831.1 xanthine dehydrogenase accessory factor [Mycobacterium sp. BK086]